MKIRFLLPHLLVMLFFNCGNNKTSSFSTKEFNFQNDSQSWEGDFSDYPVGQEEFYELNFEYSVLPKPLDSSIGSLRQSGNNHSDDLFMFIRRQIKNLEPNSNYKLSFEIEFATNVADGMFGVGGSPGESVIIKAGAVANKPGKVAKSGFYIMNIDKGNQTQGGSDMIVLGNFSNNTNNNQYTLKTLTTPKTLNVTTNNQGELWLIIGVDSGFEATTTIYFNRVKIKLER